MSVDHTYISDEIKAALDAHEKLINKAIRCAELNAKNHDELAESVMQVVELHRDFVGAGRIIKRVTFVAATAATAFAYFKWVHEAIF